MRYGLHNIDGVLLGEFATAQDVANVAQAGQFSYDRAPDALRRVCAFYTDGTTPGIIGRHFAYRCDAVEFLRSRT